MSDEEFVDPVAEDRANRVKSLGVRDVETGPTGEDDPLSPSGQDSQPRNEKGQFIPKARFDEVNQRRKEAEERAQYWDMLMKDQDAVDYLSNRYGGGTGSPPPTASPPSQQHTQYESDDMMGDLSPAAMKLIERQAQELQGLKKHVAQLTAPIMESFAAQQRQAIKAEWPDFDPERDEPQIRTLMATQRARSPLDAYRIIRAERGDARPRQKADNRAAASVQIPSEVREYGQALEKDYQEAKRDYIESGSTDQEALKAMVDLNTKRQELRKHLSALGGG